MNTGPGQLATWEVFHTAEKTVRIQWLRVWYNYTHEPDVEGVLSSQPFSLPPGCEASVTRYGLVFRLGYPVGGKG